MEVVGAWLGKAYFSPSKMTASSSLPPCYRFIPAKAGDFEMIILKNVDLYSFVYNRNCQRYSVWPRSLDEKVQTGGF